MKALGCVMMRRAAILLSLLLISCAYQEKPRSDMGIIKSSALLGDTNAPVGSVFLTKIYVIQPGDTLLKIAKKFGTTVNEVRRLNQMRTQQIFVGQRIRVAEERIE